MANKGNYILIHRRIMDWEWYRNGNTFRVFVHCLLRANWKEGRFEGRRIMPGQFVTSIGNMAQDLGLTYDQVRQAILHLNITQEITHEKIPQGLIITVKNWSRYQKNPTQNPTEIPDESHTNPNNRIRDNKLPKKEKNIPSESEELSDEEWLEGMNDGTI